MVCVHVASLIILMVLTFLGPFFVAQAHSNVEKHRAGASAVLTIFAVIYLLDMTYILVCIRNVFH
jgi:hypothetical protein